MAKHVQLRIPEFTFIAATRVAMGIGIGFLLAERMNRHRRRNLGWTLFAIGAGTTVPIVVGIVKNRSPFRLVA
jgi:hypothetical protein